VVEFWNRCDAKASGGGGAIACVTGTFQHGF